ncbi:hypothetical protein C5167_029037 [Papaver somniferum]|nr:hypothetical protein C5167_029037 [Papaver somniferum]
MPTQDLFNSKNFEWEGDTSMWKNASLPSEYNSSVNFIEFVTSPNNPDAELKEPVLLKGPSVKTIFDHAYYWPHYTAIPAPANEDLMIFTLSKLTGHASSRFGASLETKANPSFTCTPSPAKLMQGAGSERSRGHLQKSI